MQDQPFPKPTMPHFPEGYIPKDAGKEKLDWRYVQERMTESINYWVATATPKGKPSATPVWAVWIDDKLYFDGAPSTRRGRNISANPLTAVHLESGEQAVMLEGKTSIFSDAPEKTLSERISAEYRRKYAIHGYEPPADQWDQGGLFEFIPSKVIAWTNFIKDPTRWILKP
jgi:hypothetical protein